MQMPCDLTIDDADFRRVVALRALYWLQESIARNDSVYSGLMVPNFTSVAHILTLATIAELRALIAQHPRLGTDQPLWGADLPRGAS